MRPDIAIVGAGYVGLPLAIAFAREGHSVRLIDVDPAVVRGVNAGESHVEDVDGEELGRLVAAGTLSAGADFDACRGAAAVLLCLPTPLTTNREPDLSAVRSAAAEIATRLERGQLVVLESTTYPGTTREVLAPILECGGLVAGSDFHLAMSPERIDPGRTDHTIRTTPKIVGGLTPACTEAAVALYGSCIDTLVPVSSADAAELTKLLENIFRSVNIALVNELAMLCHRMGLDVWEVVDAAATKPYGFMPFRPGPGLGGHCLPIDPFYLSWRAREYDFTTEFIELAGKVNQAMPYHCAERVAHALNGIRKPVAGSRVLVVGVAYKSDVGDLRESPALKLMELLAAEGADVAYHDPHVPALVHGPFDLRSQPLAAELLEAVDIVCVVTAHSSVDHGRLAERAALVLDFRNVVPRERGNVVAL